MALITCSECEKQISDSTTSCPHCGNPKCHEPLKAGNKDTGELKPSITCKSCLKEVSSWAPTCPHCGQKNPTVSNRQMALGCGCLTLIVLVVIIPAIIGSCSAGDSKPKTKEENRQAQLEGQFSAWDGSHNGLTKLIKSAMNDPGSYEHVKTVHWDEGDSLIVKTTYTGKNGFGGRVKGWMKARIDSNGNVIEVLGQE